MTEPAQRDTIALPTASVLPLATLLCELDEFLRSGHPVDEVLTGFLRDRGHKNPGFAACNIIDALCFTAAHFRSLTHDIGQEFQQEQQQPDTG